MLTISGYFLQEFAYMYFSFISSFKPTNVEEYRQQVHVNYNIKDLTATPTH